MKTETPAVKMVAIADDEAGQRIDNFLRTQLKGVPKSMIYRILRKGEVRVNKKRVKPSTNSKRAMKCVFRRCALRSVKKRRFHRSCRKWRP
jgi:23S rRNA-/tRNA-specific pseudouridylate synthase